MDSPWSFQQLMQLGAARTATAASAGTAAPGETLQYMFDDWGGKLQGASTPAMPPSPQTMNANRRGADAAGTAAPSSPTHLQPRKNSSHFTSPKGVPKTPKASRKACPEEDEQPEADPCEDALQMFAGRYGFTVTTTNTCTTYSNARCGLETGLQNRASASQAEAKAADAEQAQAASGPDTSFTVEQPPAGPPAPAPAPAPAPSNTTMPCPATDNTTMLPPMPRLPFTALLSQPSFQQPATPAVAAAAERPAAAASLQSSPAFFRTVSTGMPALQHCGSSAHNSQALAALQEAGTATDSTHQAGTAAAVPPSFMAWAAGAPGQKHSNPPMDPHSNALQQLSNYLQHLPNPASEHHHQQQQEQQHQGIVQQQTQQPGGAGWDALGVLQAQAALVFGGMVPLDARAPAGTKPAEATQAPVALLPANWSPMQSMGLGFQFVPTPHYQGGQDHQHGQQQQQGPSSPTRTTPTKPGSPGKVRRQGSPSKGKRDGSQSPSRNNNSGNAQQHAASAAYQQILRRRLRRPKSRGPSYDPSIKTAAAAAAHYGTGASLLGKHRLSNCSSMEEAAAGPEGMPHEWAGDATGSGWLYGPDGWDEEDAFASGCLGEAASMMGDSLGFGGFEGYVWPLDGAFAEEDGPQLQQPVYACTPAAAAAAAAAGMLTGARRASSMSSDWFRELGVQDMAVSRRSSLFDDNMSINAPAAAAPAAAGAGMGYWCSSDAEVESALQRGLDYMPVWGVQANVGEVLMQHKVIDGSTTPDKFYDDLCKGPC